MIEKTSITQRLLKGDLSIIFYFSLVRLLLHFGVSIGGGYGFFRDELYYLACADHLAWGYVDQPPLSIFILKFFTAIFGDSLFAVRIVPALCGAFTIFFTGLITIRLGGKRFAQVLACIASFSLISVGMNSIYSMNSIDILIWTAVAYVVLLIIQEEKKQLWIVLGVLLGLGLLNKVGVLFLGVGLFAGLLISPQRKWLLTPWPYVAGAIAFIFFMPYIVWNLQHDNAHLEFIRRASEGKYSSLTPLKFIKDQFLINNPLASPVWIAGLFALLFLQPLNRYRFLAFLYVGPLIIFVANGTSKSEYLAAGYAVLWAAGSVWWEALTNRKSLKLWLRPLLILLIFGLNILFMPMVLTVLPVEKYISYAKVLGQEPSSVESKELAELPQFYADMFGWQQKAIDVAEVYNTLTDEEKSKCAIFGMNYGDCGAIDYFGGPLGLPKAIGNHNNYWIWGPRGYTGEIVIIMGGDLEDHADHFESVKLMKVHDCQYCMPYEDNMNIFLARKLVVTLDNIWEQEKHYE
jgi:hypothetical protein